MLAIERKNEILEKLRQEQRVLVSELSVHYGVTEETIRRDLDKLEREGYATKTYGGAIWGNSTKSDLSYIVRNKTNIECKRAIAQTVASLVHNGDHIMLDESSTSLFVAKELKESKKELTLITNSVEIVMELRDVPDWNIMSTGGRLLPNSLELAGPQCHQMLRGHHVDKLIMSCKGIDVTAGITDSSEYHSSTKQTMMASSQKAILALDHTKFDKISFVRIADFKDISVVVTDRAPSREWQEFFERIQLPCRFPEAT